MMLDTDQGKGQDVAAADDDCDQVYHPSSDETAQSRRRLAERAAQDTTVRAMSVKRFYTLGARHSCLCRFGGVRSGGRCDTGAILREYQGPTV